MELITMNKNCMGTMDFTLKLGKMKKAEKFCTYPIQKDANWDILYLQSAHRWAEVNTRTGKVTLSARRAQYANSVWLTCCRLNGTCEEDTIPCDTLENMLDAIRGTASPMAGGNNILSMYCDNSNAGLV